MPSIKRKSSGPSNAVLEERLSSQCERIDDLKIVLDKVLSAVNDTKLNVAMLPTWDSVKQLHADTRNVVEGVNTRVKVLEDSATESRGSKKAWVAVAGLAGGSVSALVGWAVSYFSTPKSPHSP